MPEILKFYAVGLMVCAAIGLGFFYLLDGPLTRLVQHVLGRRTGALRGRASSILMFLSIMLGGLSTQWYGCGGYNDYQAIARDRRLMFEKTTEQVAGAIDYGRTFVLLAAGVSAIVVAVLAIRPRDHDGGRNDTTRDEGAHAKHDRPRRE